MRFLIVGLGSMGKRRIRNLQALNAGEILGFDPKGARAQEANSRYGIGTYTDFQEAMACNPDALIISTPPDLHMHYAHAACDTHKHFFTEAGVTDEGVPELIRKLSEDRIVGVPSCTMRFYPAPRTIERLLREGAIGKPLSFTYQSGQYLPDWHPWEDYRTYYVSKKETGACREIVPFELVWLTWAFDDIALISCMFDKVSPLETDIDDVYHLLLRFRNGLIGHLTVDVIARPAVRHIRILGTEGTLEWNNEWALVRCFRDREKTWKEMPLDKGTVEEAYINPEEPYIEEMRRFVRAIREGEDFGYSFEEDHRILRLLYLAEQSCLEARHIPCPNA